MAGISLALVQYLGERRSGALDQPASPLIAGPLQCLLDAAPLLGEVSQESVVIVPIVCIGKEKHRRPLLGVTYDRQLRRDRRYHGHTPQPMSEWPAFPAWNPSVCCLFGVLLSEAPRKSRSRPKIWLAAHFLQCSKMLH